VAVCSHAEEDIVEAILALFAPSEGVLEGAFVIGFGGGGHGEDGMNLLRGKVGVVADQVADGAVVAVFVVEGDAAFIDDPEVGAAPGEAAIDGIEHEAAVEGLGGGSAGEGEVEVAEFADAVFGVDEEIIGEGINDIFDGVADLYYPRKPGFWY